MKDIDIIIEIDGNTINVNTDMIEEDVIRQRMGLEPKSYDWIKKYKINESDQINIWSLL